MKGFTLRYSCFSTNKANISEMLEIQSIQGANTGVKTWIIT